MRDEIRALLWFGVGAFEGAMLIPYGWLPPLVAFGVLMAGWQGGRAAQRAFGDDTPKGDGK